MLRRSTAMFISPRQFCWFAVAILVTGPLAASSKVHALATPAVDQSDRREAGRPDGDGERKLMADLVRVQSAAAEDFDLGQFDRDMTAAFRAYGLDLDRVDSKEARARLAGWRSTAEVVAAIDDWCNVRRRELGALSWRRLADMARAIDTDAWRTALRDQFDRPPGEAIAALRARAADVKAMQRQPARSLVLLVRMLWDAGDPATAIPVLNVAERRFPDDFWVCIELGNLSMVDAPITDPAEAARYFSRAIALKPRSYAAHENLANALVDQKKFDGAIAEFRVAIKLNPGNPDTYHNLGEALLLQGKTPEAIATLELAIRIRPELHDAHFALGVALGSQGRQGDAIAAFREAIRLNPELIDAQDTVRIERGRDGALAAFREAIRDLPRPVAVRPAVMVKVVNNKMAHPGGGDHQEGFPLDPQAAGHIERGYAWITKREFDKAIAELSEAIRLEPGCSVAYIHRAFTWSSKREYGKAIADFDKAVVLDPQNAAAYNDRAWLRATCPVAEYRDGTKAVESAIWACALSGWKNAHPLGTLAAAYAEASDFASAVKCQTKAIKLLAAELERKDFGARLELYQARKAYRQAPSD
jgi:tetratricopeptide (TPR) repeat protein